MAKIENVFGVLESVTSWAIRSYRDDLLKIDRELIRQNPDVPFIHWTRENGTHMQFLWPHDSAAWPKSGEKVPYLFGMAGREHISSMQIEEVVRTHGRYRWERLVAA